MYREIWTYLFSNNAWRKAELERVQIELSAIDIAAKERTAYTIAAIHLSLIDNQDEQAADWLSELMRTRFPIAFIG